MSPNHSNTKEGSSAIGIETEFEVAAIGGRGRYLPSPDHVNRALLQLRAEKRGDLDRRLFDACQANNPSYWHNEGRHALPNGACIMLDRPRGRFEYCTSEASSARNAVIATEAGRRIVQRAAVREFKGLPVGVFDHNINHLADYSFGSHESYWIDRSVADRLLKSKMLPLFLIVRQLWAGSGAVENNNGFRISQRAPFIKVVEGDDTKNNRPLVCTRDEALGNHDRGFRLHLISGDSNVLRSAQFLKLLSTELFLRAFERGEFSDIEPLLQYDRSRAVEDLQAVSSTTGNWKLNGFAGGPRPALEIADIIVSRIKNAFWKDLNLEESEGLKHLEYVLSELRKLSGEVTTDGLSKDNLTPLAGYVDWASKKINLDAAKIAAGIDLNFVSLASICRDYHAVMLPGRNEDPTARNGALRGWFRDNEIEAAIHKPDQNTRAALRSELVDQALHFKVPANKMFVGWSTYGVKTPTGWIRGDMDEPGIDYRGRHTPAAAIGALAGVVQAQREVTTFRRARAVREMHYSPKPDWDYGRESYPK